MQSAAILVSIVFATSDAAAASDAEPFMAECVAALRRDGRSAEAATGPCECVARRTEDRPQLRTEFLEHLKALRDDRALKPSQELRQVRTACIPMPIWGLASDSHDLD